MCSKHRAESVHALISGALFYGANNKPDAKHLSHLFESAVSFSKDSTFAQTAMKNVSWYWNNGMPEDDGTMKVHKKKAFMDLKLLLHEFYNTAGNTLASNSLRQDNKKQELFVAINRYKSNSQ